MDLFFLFKRLVGMVMQPLALFFILAAVGAILAKFTRFRRLAVLLIGTAVLVLALGSFPPLVRWSARTIESRYAPLLNADADASEKPGPFAIVVLGNGVAHPGDEKMPALTRLNDAARARLVEGVRLSRLYPDARLITCGYGMGMENCADAMAGAAIELGVPAERIDRLAESLDTAHEARLVRELAEDREVLVVTSAAHMPRSMAYFAAEGVRARAAPCDFIAPVSDQTLANVNLQRWRPRGVNVADSEEIWHEWMGLAYLHWIRGDGSGE